MRTVAERLMLGLAAGAPVVGLSCFELSRKWSALYNLTFQNYSFIASSQVCTSNLTPVIRRR